MFLRNTWALARNGLLKPKLLPLLYEGVPRDVRDHNPQLPSMAYSARLFAEGQCVAQAKLSSLLQDTVGTEAPFGHISADNPSSATQYEVRATTMHPIHQT